MWNKTHSTGNANMYFDQNFISNHIINSDNIDKNDDLIWYNQNYNPFNLTLGNYKIEAIESFKYIGFSKKF